MGFLAVLGRDIEAMWGPARFLAIYLIAGVVSACAVIFISRLDAFRSHEVPITVGASGPLYGLFTAMVVWFSLNHEHLPENLLQEWSQTIGLSLILLVASSFVPSVSWQGHFGGAVGGLLSGLLLHWNRFHPAASVRRLALVMVPLVPVAFLCAVLWQAGYF
jgi:membrane associated rhomboid family serine protease